MAKEKTKYIVEFDEDFSLSFLQKLYRAFKAFADFIIALIFIILLSPLFLITAIAIKIDSKGPVFFTHKRIGFGGKEFKCIKFRSMSKDARHDIAGYNYLGVDEYITRVGKVIRKLSIDELPQLFCVLAFKMSIIGYRPSQASEIELNTARADYGIINRIRPGITGWAQVNGRDILAANPVKKAQYDAYYLKHFSIWLDIKILFITIAKVFKSSDVVDGAVAKNTVELKEVLEQEIAVSNENLKESNISETTKLGEDTKEVG